MDVPYSDIYDDIYYSPENGFAESCYVFLGGNKLPQRWKDWNRRHFVIGETGFGTGLNFLSTWLFWKKFKNQNSNHSLKTLFFVSVEKYPLSTDSIRKYLSHFPELNELLSVFLDKYSLPSPGFYRFHFPGDNIVLQILYGDAMDLLPELDASVDAWYLDGFNPAKNKDLWNEKLFQEILRLSKSGTTFATFTSAGFVRRGLSEIGFHVKKISGYGKKREMSVGELDITPDIDSDTLQIKCKPVLKENLGDSPVNPEFHIIGGGIAGVSVAYSLRLRDLPSRIFDGTGIGKKASGNPAGIFYPYLTKFPIPISLFSLQAFYYALQFLDNYDNRGPFDSDFVKDLESALDLESDLDLNLKLDSSFTRKTKSDIQGNVGLDFLLGDPKKKERYLAAMENFGLPSSVAEFRQNPDRIFFPKGRTIYPADWVQYLFKLSGAEWIQEDWNVEKIYSENITHFFCNSYMVNELPSLKKGNIPPVKKVRGQLAITKQDLLEKELNHPICSDTYLSPGKNDTIVMGSTYDEFRPDRGWDEKDEKKILEDANTILSFRLSMDEILQDRSNLIKKEIAESGEWEGTSFRVSHRAQTKDRVPLIGEINEGYIFSGLGSRGLVYGLLGGELLVSLSLGEPLPIPLSVFKGISPTRFL